MNGMNKTEGMTVEEVMRRDKRFRYMLLARLQSDCEYYLGFGNRSTGRLWAGDEARQIEWMTRLYDGFPEDEKPRWLVNFRYNLRRKGMVKDTIHTTELDTTYARGVELLQKRKYAKALYILNDYNDRNTVVAHLSLDHNERAMELLAAMPEDAATEYLRAIACSRLGRKEEGRRHFLEACRLDERMEYRGNLDPEIAELLK